jgi:hypothetical protein
MNKPEILNKVPLVQVKVKNPYLQRKKTATIKKIQQLSQ